MAASDDIIEHASEFLRRISPEGRATARRRRDRRKAAFRRIAKRIVFACIAIWLATMAIGAFVPIGILGVFGMILAMALTAAAIALWSRAPDARPEAIVTADLAQLPARTEDWLETQRPALPAPAQRQLDALGLSLEALAPQLVRLDPNRPEALEVRRLIGDELPELIRGYQKVPQALRREPMDGGPSPDRHLADGLRTIDAEITRMNSRLAAADLKALATQNRYLEIKYKGDGEMGEG